MAQPTVKDSQAVVIIGSPRSGTSSIAQALSGLGLYLDTPDQLVTANAENADGYYEHITLSGIFGHFQMAQNQPVHYIDTIPQGWQEMPRMHDLLQAMRNLVLERFSDHKLWGWKSPLSSSQIPIIVEALKPLEVKLTFVICVRHPLAVAKSQQSKYDIPLRAGFGIWLWNTLEALRYSRGYRTIIIPFPEVVNDYKTYMQRVVDSVPGWEPSQEHWDTLKDLFKPQLIHNKPGTTEEPVPQVALKTYELAMKCANQHEQFAKGEFDNEINQLATEMADWQDMFRIHTMIRDEVRAWYQDNGQMKVATELYAPTRQWQSVTLDLVANQSHFVPVHFYFLPVHVWVRKAEWIIDGHKEEAKLQGAKFGAHSKVAGVDCFAVVPGAEQMGVMPPSRSGPATLELEFLIEQNSQHESETYRNIVQHLETLQKQVQALQSKPQFQSVGKGIGSKGW